MAVKSYMASPLCAPLQPPWLMQLNNDKDDDDAKANGCRFLTLSGKVHEANNIFVEVDMFGALVQHIERL